MVMVGIIGSRLLGIVRESAFANVFGAEAHTDAYFQSFRIPELLYNLMAAGALAAGLVPAFTERLTRGKKKEAWELFRSLLTVLTLLATVIIGVASFYSPALALLVGRGPGFTPEVSALCASLMRIMLPAQIFFVVGGLFMGALNSFRIFVWSAVAPGIYNLFIIVGVLVFGPRIGLFGAAWGVFAGAFVAQVLLQGPPLKRLGASFRPMWAPLSPGVKQVARLFFPVTLGLCLSQINFMVSSVIAAGLGPSSVSYFNYAFRLIWFPIGVFGTSLGISLFPALSTHASLDEVAEFRHKLALGLRMLLFVVLPATCIFMLLSAELVRFLYQSGRFTGDNTAGTASALVLYSPAILFLSLQQLAARAFYALQKSKVPVSVGGPSVLLCIGLSWLLSRSMGLEGITLGNSVASGFNCVVLIFLLSRTIGGLELDAFGRCMLRSLLALLPLALVTYASSQWCHAHLPGQAKILQALQFLIPTALGSGVYIVAAFLLRSREISYLLRVLSRRKVAASPQDR